MNLTPGERAEPSVDIERERIAYDIFTRLGLAPTPQGMIAIAAALRAAVEAERERCADAVLFGAKIISEAIRDPVADEDLKNGIYAIHMLEGALERIRNPAPESRSETTPEAK